jgi:hypothetical protein
MANTGYPPSLDQIRKRLELLSTLDAGAPEWIPFMRDIMRMPMWLCPAVHAAVHQGGWAATPDPLESIRRNVRRLAMEMKLSNTHQPPPEKLLKPEEDAQ